MRFRKVGRTTVKKLRPAPGRWIRCVGVWGALPPSRLVSCKLLRVEKWPNSKGGLKEVGIYELVVEGRPPMEVPEYQTIHFLAATASAAEAFS